MGRPRSLRFMAMRDRCRAMFLAALAVLAAGARAATPPENVFDLTGVARYRSHFAISGGNGPCIK